MKRNFGLDVVRTFSIWLVLLQHGGINIPGLAPLRIGGIGVEIFFVLSGFLIGGIIFNDLKKDNTLFQTLKHFWIRRWFRILPLYYIILAFKFIVIDHSVGWNLLYYVFFLQNNFYGISFLDVSWSLVIEEWFYIVSPVFLFLSYRFFKSKPYMLYAIIGFIVLINLLRLLYVINGNIPYSGVNSNPPFRFDALFLGVLLAYINDNFKPVFAWLSRPVIFITGLFAFALYIYVYWRNAFPVNHIDTQWWPRTIGFFILPCSIAITIPFLSTIQIDKNNGLVRKVLFTFITQTSLLTYAIYLIHPFVYQFCFSQNKIPFAFQWVLTIAFTYILAALAYRYIEKPFLKLRDKFEQKNKLSRYLEVQ